MKARVKATGEIGIVSQIDVLLKDDFVSFNSNNVEILQNYADATIDPDYWTHLEHQYAGMAMQGILSNPEVDLDYKSDEFMPQAVAATAYNIAHALIQKLKEKEERK